MSWSSWPTTGVAPPTVVQGPVINSAPNVANPAAATSMVAQGQYTPEQWAQMQQHNWQQWAQWQQQFQQWQQQYGAEYQKTMSAMAHARGGPAQSTVPYYNMTTPAQPPLPIETKPPPPPDDSHGGQAQPTQPSQQQVPQQQQQLQQQQLQQQLQQQQLQQQQLQQQQLQQQQLQQHQLPQQQPPLPQTQSTTAPTVASSLYTATQYTQPPPMLPGNYTSAPPPPQSTPKNQYQYNQNQQPNAMQKNQGGFDNRGVPDDSQKFGRNQNFTGNKNNTNWQNLGVRNQGSRADFGGKRPFNQPGNERDVKRNRLDNQPEGNKWQGGNQRSQRWGEPGNNQRNQRWGEPSFDSEQHMQNIDGTNNQRNNQRWGEPSNRMDNRQQLKPAYSGVKPNSDEPSEAEKKFDKQFGEWEAQFQKWKEQNANHPDKSQYQEYEKKWVTWRAQLLERREQMRRKRLGISGEGSSSQDKSQSIIKANESQPTFAELQKDHSQPSQFAQQHSYSDNKSITHTPQIGPQVIPPPMGKSSSENPHDMIISVSEFTENKQCLVPTAEPTDVVIDLESSHNENNQVIETSGGDLPPENVTSGTSEAEGNSILNIPGLDLENGKQNTEESAIAEEQKQKPDLEAISRGINSILGDQNLMNMLSLVSQAQPSQSTTTDTQNTVVLAQSDSPKFSSEDYSGNTENEEFLSQDNIDDQSQNSFPATNNLENLNRLNEEENVSFNFGIESDYKGQEVTGNVDNVKGPQHTFNKGFNDFNRTNTFNRFNANDNVARASNSDFNQESDRFDKSVDNFAHGRNISQGSDNFNRISESSKRGPDNNFTSDGLGRSVENFNRNTDSFNKTPDNFSQNSSNFNRTIDNFNRGLDNFNRGPENFNQGLGNFNRGPDNSNRGSGGFNRGLENFNRGTDRFNRGSDNFNRTPSEHFNPSPDNFSRGSGNFNRGPDHVREQDSFSRNADKFGGKLNNPPKNPPSLLDIDFSKSPLNFNKGLGNFSKGSDNNRGQDFDRSWESDNSRRSSDEFNREGSTAGAGNFKGNDGGFNKGGGGAFNRNPESNRRGFDNFNRGGNDFLGSRIDVERGSDNFPRGRGDNFTRGDSENFDGDADNFNRGGSDNFNKGRDGLNRGGTQDRFNRGADLFAQEPENSYQEPENFNMLANDFDRGPEKFNTDTRLGKRPPNSFVGHGNTGRDLNRIEPLILFEPPSPRMKSSAPLDAVVPLIQEEKDNGIWKPSTVIDYEHKSLKPTEPDILLIPINTFDYRHKLLSRIPFPQRPKWLSDTVRNIPQFDAPLGRQFDSRNLFDDHDRKIFDEKDRRAFDARDRKLLDDRDRKSLDDRNRKFFDDRDRDRAPFEDRDRKFFDDHDRKSFDDRDRKVFDDRDRKVFDDRDRKSFDERDRKSFDDRDKKAYDNWDRKFYDDRDRKSFETRDKKSFEDRDRKSLDDRERKYIDDRERKFFDERGRKYSEDRDRKANDDRKDRKQDDRDRRSSDDRDRRRSDEHDYKSYGNRDQKDQDEFKEIDDNLESQDFDVINSKDNQFEESENSFKFDGSEQRNTTDADEPNFKQGTGKTNVTLIDELLSSPGRFNRPPRIVIILRGPPGSGKSYLAKLIKDKEVENGGSAPRIICLDDYFMVDQEKEIEEDGEKVKVKEMVYEYEECMEATYRQSLMKSFKKTITDGYFSFIIVDNINDKVKYFGDMWSFAKQNGFQVYICETGLDVQACTKRNIHGRSEIEIERCVAGWEPTPSHHPIVDASSLLQIDNITEVEMEESTSPLSIEANVEPSLMAPANHYDHPKPWKTTSNWMTGPNQFQQNQDKKGFGGLTWKNTKNKRK